MRVKLSLWFFGFLSVPLIPYSSPPSEPLSESEWREMFGITPQELGRERSPENLEKKRCPSSSIEIKKGTRAKSVKSGRPRGRPRKDGTVRVISPSAERAHTTVSRYRHIEGTRRATSAFEDFEKLQERLDDLKGRRDAIKERIAQLVNDLKEIRWDLDSDYQIILSIPYEETDEVANSIVNNWRERTRKRELLTAEEKVLADIEKEIEKVSSLMPSPLP